MIRYNELTEQLHISERTLRRWVTVLENQGWVFEKDESGRRFFSDRETLMIEEMKELSGKLKLMDAAIELIRKYGHGHKSEENTYAHDNKVVFAMMDELFKSDWLKVTLYCNPAPMAIKLLQDKWDQIKTKLG